MSISKSILMNTIFFQMLKKDLGNKYNSTNLFLETYNYNVWLENEELTNTTSEKCYKEESVDLSDMSPLEDDEEKLKKEKVLTNWNLSKLLTKLQMLLTQKTAKK